MSEGVPIYVSDDMARALIDTQFPWLADDELGRRYTLKDQFAIRIGDDYGAIFPRYKKDDYLYARVAPLIRAHSASWNFPSSHPIATGMPGAGYPYHWVLVEWRSASTAGFVPLDAASAAPLGAAVREIHTPCRADAPVNPRTGMGLPALRDEFMALVRFAQNVGAPENRVLDADATQAVFEAGASTDGPGTLTWTHGRLEPRAVLSDRGTFFGILLWHNYGAGDPAADLGYGANLLTLKMRDDFWAGYGGVDTATATRASAYQAYAALKYIKTDDPFLLRMAWERFIELGLAREA